ncbi:transglycosylase SLT domain-containing protein, partial [Nocardia sp. NPDC050408]|uniref:transglycosylase SLT domain-containing protein n=1 Tax=Nocardia sp. NPDC050408 TaxID=3364319 RepID=UPI0037B8F550
QYTASASGSGGASSYPTVGGTVGGWIQQALQALRSAGYDVSRINPSDIATIIQHESTGNPNAINNWDGNARAGTPTKGLMQLLDSNFQKYHVAGTSGNIYDPVANIAAGIIYALDRYGSIDNVEGIKALRNGRAYVGY